MQQHIQKTALCQHGNPRPTVAFLTAVLWSGVWDDADGGPICSPWSHKELLLLTTVTLSALLAKYHHHPGSYSATHRWG